MARLRRQGSHDSTDAEIRKAMLRGEVEQKAAYARSVRYSPSRDSFVLTMYSGTNVEIPRSLIPYIREATRAEASCISLSPAGSSLHWEQLDMDLSVPGLIKRVFGMDVAFRAEAS